MFRLIAYLAAVTVLLILISNAGIFWSASHAIKQSKQDTVAALANGIGLSISAQVDLLNKSLDKMAQDLETVQAVAGGNPESIRHAADRLTQLLPHALNVRLLLPGVTESDDKNSPQMTYADLNMVRETFSGPANPLPAIQGDDPNNRYLALARKIMQGKQTIGVLLAGFDDDIIRNSLLRTRIDDGYIQLHQGKLLLAHPDTRIPGKITTVCKYRSPTPVGSSVTGETMRRLASVPA